MIAKNCRAVLGNDLSFLKLNILLNSFEKCISYAFLVFLYSVLTVSDSKHQRITHAKDYSEACMSVFMEAYMSVANGYFA